MRRDVILRPTALLLGLLLACGLLAVACGGGNGDGEEATATAAAASTAPAGQEGTPANGATPGGAATPAGGATVDQAIEHYFRELERLAIQYDTDVSKLQDALDLPDDASDEEAIQTVQGYMEDAVTIAEDFVEGLQDMGVPPALEDAHNEALAAGEDVVAALTALKTQALAATNAGDLQAILDGLTGQSDVFGRFRASCSALLQIAQGYGLSPDLRCG